MKRGLGTGRKVATIGLMGAVGFIQYLFSYPPKSSKGGESKRPLYIGEEPTRQEAGLLSSDGCWLSCALSLESLQWPLEYDCENMETNVCFLADIPKGRRLDGKAHIHK